PASLRGERRTRPAGRKRQRRISWRSPPKESLDLLSDTEKRPFPPARVGTTGAARVYSSAGRLPAALEEHHEVRPRGSVERLPRRFRRRFRPAEARSDFEVNP